MELGPIQRQWLGNLENYPERQTDAILGERFEDGDGYRACCLGEYLITYRRAQGMSEDEIWSNGCTLIDGVDRVNGVTNDSDLEENHDVLGLHDSVGTFLDHDGLEVFITVNGEEYANLADMNDEFVSWPKIAGVIRENVDLVFCKSV